MKAKFLIIFVIAVLGLSTAHSVSAATKVKADNATQKTFQSVKKKAPLKATKIRYKQGLIINAPLINPRFPPGGAR